MKAFFRSFIPKRPSRKIEQKPKTPSPPKAKTSTPTSQKSNRATRGSTASRSVYSSRAPELTDAVVAKQVKTPSKSNSATRERLEFHPAKTATPRRTGKLPPLKHKNNPNILKVLTEDALSQVFKQVALQHPQQIVLNNDFLKFYKETTLNLHVSKNFNREDLDTRLLSKLHTIYLNNSPITSEIIKILEKNIKI